MPEGLEASLPQPRVDGRAQRAGEHRLQSQQTLDEGARARLDDLSAVPIVGKPEGMQDEER
eukprot:1296580-Pyramimonas_sp.AAC.1